MNAARSPFFHERDHIDASPEDREFYHHLCVAENNCAFVNHIESGKDASTYQFSRADSNGNPATGGILCRPEFCSDSILVHTSIC